MMIYKFLTSQQICGGLRKYRFFLRIQALIFRGCSKSGKIISVKEITCKTALHYHDREFVGNWDWIKSNSADLNLSNSMVIGGECTLRRQEQE
ncbi:MAG: hypothetical protein LBT70_01595 [Holosporaceae bacterium]|nr:hypothetical protein [Holosporaceae bacterium]